ncbi:uncharacterized protein PgNI_01370 [Pyricularia grisea]|uniref:Uncharacterized protein n=1 Tax=Pyricularia grisea TaxID=148305 RepID=A0A6P8BJT0_PYRGI|nr:uncharacterized protein PgNI_01370 [Pyricularia grisea]TLD16837.1 hypothetical protein PgNI_01370 [Pyricularia grisea]
MRADDVADDDSMGRVRTKSGKQQKGMSTCQMQGMNENSSPRILQADRSITSGAVLGQWRPVRDYEVTAYQRRRRVVRKAADRPN